MDIIHRKYSVKYIHRLESYSLQVNKYTIIFGSTFSKRETGSILLFLNYLILISKNQENMSINNKKKKNNKKKTLEIRHISIFFFLWKKV